MDRAGAAGVAIATETLLLVPILVIAIALVILVFTRRKRQSLQMPTGTTVYQDRQEQRGILLYSHKFRLKGRPDFLLGRNDGSIIPVEAKTGRTPNQPYDSHIMQLIAYCVLVEENYGIRPAYGVIRYPGKAFEIAFPAEREAELEGVLVDMRAKLGLPEVHRNHNSGKSCAACGYREHCSERPDLQITLPQ